MRSVLDEAGSWDLESVEFTGMLTVTLSELRPGPSAPLKVGQTELGTARRVSVVENGRRVVVTFPLVLAYRVVDESYTTREPVQRLGGDEGQLAVFERSGFLDTLGANSLMAPLVDKAVRHYALRTEDFVIDVAATTPPRIELLPENARCAGPAGL